MKLKHIDNGHFRLTDAQAAQLCKRWGGLPRLGYSRQLDEKTDLDGVELLFRSSFLDNGKWGPGKSKAKDATIATVLRTRLAWHDGKPLPKGWTWALHLYFAP